MTTPDDIRAMRRDGDLRAYLRNLRDTAAAECARRRAAVLRWPDLAARLTEPPISHATPDAWTGYIPPATFNGGPNTHPARRALIDLTTEAEHRARPRGAAA